MDTTKAHRISKIGLYIIVLSLSFFSCDTPEEEVILPNAFTFDLDSIKARGRLVALVDNSSTSYFTYKGQPMGFEYELLKRFTESIGVDLDVRIVYRLDSVLHYLNRGEGDIVAANITVTKPRSELVSFSNPMLKTKQVLVQHRKNKKRIDNASELAGRTIHVRAGSSFYDRLKNLENEIGADIDIVTQSDTNDFQVRNKTLQLIEAVANEEIEFTVADENIAKVEKKMYPQIDISTPISFTQNIAWAMRKTDTSLAKAVNAWLGNEKKRNDYYTIHTKYFKARTVLKKKLKSEYSSYNGGLSPYDEILKDYSSELNWDWRLLASQVYQESKFDPNAQAWTGATGLMQLLPSTAQAYDVDSNTIREPEQNIKAGVSYLKWLDQCWSHTISDSLERTKFVLASYNVGLGHIIDARNLAYKYEKNPALWEDNVAEYVLLKSEKEYYTDEVCKHGYCRGREPYNYVIEVIDRYEHYKNLIPE